MRSDTWRPLAAAPPAEGRDVLVAVPSRDGAGYDIYVGYLWHGRLFLGDGDRSITYRDPASFGRPVYWRPLPAPPPAEAEADAEPAAELELDEPQSYPSVWSAASAAPEDRHARQ